MPILLHNLTHGLVILSLLFSSSLSISPPRQLKAQSSDGVLVLSNDQISLTLFGGMTFTLDDSAERPLLFPGPTSFLSMRVDGDVYTPGSAMSETDLVRVDQASARETYTTPEGLTLIMEYRLAGPAVQFSAVLDNSSGDSRDVYVRILLDTQVDENDGSPLWAAGEVHTHEHELQPPYSIAMGYDRIPDPNLTTTATFLTRPDRVIFAHWPSAVQADWMYPADSGQAFYTPGFLETPESDSAILVYYDLGTPAQGETPAFSLAYGLSAPEGSDDLQSLILELQRLEQALVNRLQADVDLLSEVHLRAYQAIMSAGTLPDGLLFLGDSAGWAAADLITLESGNPAGMLLRTMGSGLQYFLAGKDEETFEQINGLLPEIYQDPLPLDSPNLEAHIHTIVSQQMQQQSREESIHQQFEALIQSLQSEGLPAGYPIEGITDILRQMRDRINLTGRQEGMLFWPDPDNEVLQFRISGTLQQSLTLLDQLQGHENTADSLRTIGFWTSAAGTAGGIAKLALLLSTSGVSACVELIVGSAALTAGAAGIAISGTGKVTEIASDQLHAYFAIQANAASAVEIGLLELIAEQTVRAVSDAAEHARLWTASGAVVEAHLEDVILQEGEDLGNGTGSIVVRNLGSQPLNGNVMGAMLAGVGAERIPVTILGNGAATLLPSDAVVSIPFSYTAPDTSSFGRPEVYTMDLWVGVGFQPIHLNEDPSYAEDLRIFVAGGEAAETLSQRQVDVVDSGFLEEGEHSSGALGIGTITSVTTLELAYPGSDFDLHLFDSSDHHVGMNYDTGTIEAEIPGVSYSGPGVVPEWMQIEGYEGETLRTEVIAISAETAESFTLTSVQIPAMPALLGADAVILTMDPPSGDVLELDLAVYEYGGQAGIDALTASIQPPHADSGNVEALSGIEIDIPSSLEPGETAFGRMVIPSQLLAVEGTYGADILLEGCDASSGEPRSVLVPVRLSIGEPVPFISGVDSSVLPETAAWNGGGGLGIALILFVAAGAVTWVVTLNRRKARGGKSGPSPAVLLDSSGKTIPLTGIELMIGRGSTCGIRIPDGKVSRQHARIRYAAGAWYIQDQGSASGTYINGTRQAACKLQSGDRITIGSSTYQFYIK